MKKILLALACACAYVLVSNATVYRPGMVQSVFQGKSDFFGGQNNAPILVSNLLTQTTYTQWDGHSCEFTYGAFMAHNGAADEKKKFTNPWTGVADYWNWPKEYSVFAYEGEIYLHEGDRVVATGRLDDGSAMIVNGVMLFNMGGTSGYNGGPSSHEVFTAPANGWYPVNAYAWDWTGGKNICGSYLSGVQYNLNGHWADFTSSDYWSRLTDPGDGSLLRSVDTTTNFMSVGFAEISGSDVKVPAAFTAVPYAAELRAYCGDADAGSDLGKWQGFVKLADIAAGDTASTQYTIPDGAGYAKIRLCLYRLADDASNLVPCTSFYEVGELMTFEQVSPTVAIVETVRTQTSLGFNITVEGYGAGAESCDLHAVLARDDEYTDVIASFDMTSDQVATLTPYELSGNGLNYGTTYYLKVEATNDQSKKRTIESAYETSPAPPCAVTFTTEKAGSTLVTFFWSVTDFGEGSSYASVSIEYSAFPSFSSSAELELESRLESPTTPARAVVRNLTTLQQYYFRLKTVNELGTVGYSEVEVRSTSATEVNRIWANTGTDMNDPASYIENLIPGSNDIVYFTEPVKRQPRLTSDLTVKGIHFGTYDLVRTTAATDPDGYVFTGVAGAKLTLSGTGSSNYAMNSATEGGRAEFNIPIVLSGNSNPHFAANGITLEFKAPISTTGTYSQNVNTVTDGKDKNHIGKLIFSAANPDFKPSKIYIVSSTRIEIRHPEALIAVKDIAAGHWGGTDYPYFINGTGGPVVMDALEKFSMDSYGLNAFTFDGSLFVLTNCVFGVSQRSGKDRTFNAPVMLKTIGGWDYGGDSFTKNGTNMLEFAEYYEKEGIVSHIRVTQGLFYPHNVLSTVARPGRRCRINSDGVNETTGVLPTLGINADVRIPVSNLGGISFGADGSPKPGGFSGMGGEVSVTLTDTNGVELVLADGTKTPENSGYVVPSKWVFGHMLSTGTVSLENDYSRTGEMAVYVYQGKADVTARLKGAITVTNGSLNKSRDGVLAIEGPLSLSDGGNYYLNASAGGLLVNTDLTGLPKEVRISGDGWLGGTGTVARFWKESGADYSALRGGEFGRGTFTVKGTGSCKFAANSGVIVDLTSDGSCGLLKFEGNLQNYASGWSGYWMKVLPQDGAPAGKYKVMDWSDGTGSPTKMMAADTYTLQYDSAKVKSATLSVENSAMYLTYLPRGPRGLKLVIK